MTDKYQTELQNFISDFHMANFAGIDCIIGIFRDAH